MAGPAMIATANLIWHQVRRAFGVLCVFLVLGFIGWAVYALVIKPQTNPIRTTQQTAREITNVNVYEDKEQFFLGIKVFGLQFGVTKRAQAKERIIGQKTDDR